MLDWERLQSLKAKDSLLPSAVWALRELPGMVTLFSRELISRRWFVHVDVPSGAGYCAAGAGEDEAVDWWDWRLPSYVPGMINTLRRPDLATSNTGPPRPWSMHTGLHWIPTCNYFGYQQIPTFVGKFAWIQILTEYVWNRGKSNVVHFLFVLHFSKSQQVVGECLQTGGQSAETKPKQSQEGFGLTSLRWKL